MTDPLIGVAELTESGARLADVRWYLNEPARGHHEYHAGHLPGAVFVSMERHLTAATGPGRHPLPPRERFASAMGSLGFGDDDLIVVYDAAGGSTAARLWWMLRDIGHEHVRVLDGGLEAWVESGKPLETMPPPGPSKQLTVRSSLTRTIDRTTLEDRLGDLVLVDARAVERYRGDEEPIDPVAGHIPTARSAPVAGNLDDAERFFLDPQALRTRYEWLGITSDDEVVVYCGSGVTACHDVLALVRAGYPEPVLYPGSWSDWCTSGGAVASGPESGSV